MNFCRRRQNGFKNLIALYLITVFVVQINALNISAESSYQPPHINNRGAGQNNVVVTLDSNTVFQTIDGFGTCLAGTEAQQSWWHQLYYEDLQASILRVDLTPQFVAPYSDFAYNSPWFHNNPSLPGPENNNVRTYTNPNNYSRTYAGRNAPIAVMKANPLQNLPLFDYNSELPKSGGIAAQAGRARQAQLGGFKLIGSIWSPPPWVKVSSGNVYGGGPYPLPAANAPYPFIWGGNYVGGKLDVSNNPLAIFNDGTQNTSSLTQFARATASYILGYQRNFNVRFDTISIQNELNFETFYNSMTYPQSAEYITALNAVREEFNKHDELRSIKLTGPEDLLGGDAYGMWEYGGGTTHKNLQYVRNVQNNPAAAAATEIFSIHGYANDGVNSSGAAPTQWNWWANGWTASPAPGITANVRGFRYFGKKSWMTETSGEEPAWLAPASGFPSNGAWSIALKIHQALTTGQQSAWVYWQLTDGGSVSPSTLTDNALRANSGKYAALKHFARYIRPGALRINAAVNNPNVVQASAYVHSANKTLTTVLINTSAQNQTVNVQLSAAPLGITQLQSFTSSNNNLWQTANVSVNSGTATAIVPAYGVTTLFGSGNNINTGLRGEYFDNEDLTNPQLTRIDSAVDFDWAAGSPAPTINGETFSARWTGHLDAPRGGVYTFGVAADDGARLWLDDRLLIDNWTGGAGATVSRRVKLEKGRVYNLRLEFVERTGNASVKLLWRLPNRMTLLQPVPSANLLP